jgi:NDP-sugar pyrophosphorylase family protein
MKAMIFAAGIGSRLGKITSERPKALVEINGKTILRMAVEKVSAAGFSEVIVNVHHFADMVEEEIGLLNSHGLSVKVSDERSLLLETGGGLFRARGFFGDEPFLLYNADVVSDIDLNELYNSHISNGGIATLAVASRSHNRVFLCDRNGIICGWMNRQTGEKIIARETTDPLGEISFSGIHIVDPAIFSYMKEGVYSMTALYLQIAGKEKICSYRHDSDFWADIGTPDQLRKVKEKFEKE